MIRVGLPWRRIRDIGDSQSGHSFQQQRTLFGQIQALLMELGSWSDCPAEGSLQSRGTLQCLGMANGFGGLNG